MSESLPQFIEQLEQELRIVIQEATHDLETADILGIFSGFQAAFDQLPQADQLRFAGSLIEQLAEVCHLRARQMGEAWETKYNATEPKFIEDILAGLVQKTTHIDISELIAPPAPRRTLKTQPRHADDSIAGVVEKSAILEVLAAIQDEDQAKQQAMNVSHDEDVATWIEEIAQWRQSHPNSDVSLLDLQQAIHLPLIPVWMALLLGGYLLEQRGEFYDTHQVWLIADS